MTASVLHAEAAKRIGLLALMVGRWRTHLLCTCWRPGAQAAAVCAQVGCAQRLRVDARGAVHYKDSCISALRPRLRWRIATLVQSDDHFLLLEAATSLAYEYSRPRRPAGAGRRGPAAGPPEAPGLPADAAPLQRLRMLNQFFFRDLSLAATSTTITTRTTATSMPCCAPVVAFPFHWPCCGWNWPRDWACMPVVWRFRGTSWS